MSLVFAVLTGDGSAFKAVSNELVGLGRNSSWKSCKVCRGPLPAFLWLRNDGKPYFCLIVFIQAYFAEKGGFLKDMFDHMEKLDECLAKIGFTILELEEKCFL